jgi:hypothetical protein
VSCFSLLEKTCIENILSGFIEHCEGRMEFTKIKIDRVSISGVIIKDKIIVHINFNSGKQASMLSRRTSSGNGPHTDTNSLIPSSGVTCSSYTNCLLKSITYISLAEQQKYSTLFV